MAPSRVARGCGVLMAVGLLDVAIRLGSGWSMVWVVRAEAALFLATSLGLLMLYLRRPTQGLATVALVLVAVLACGQASRQAASDAPAPRAVPVYQEPRHRLVFQSALARVLDVRIGPGDTTAYHIHADPMVLSLIHI